MEPCSLPSSISNEATTSPPILCWEHGFQPHRPQGGLLRDARCGRLITSKPSRFRTSTLNNLRTTLLMAARHATCWATSEKTSSPAKCQGCTTPANPTWLQCITNCSNAWPRRRRYWRSSQHPAQSLVCRELGSRRPWRDNEPSGMRSSGSTIGGVARFVSWCGPQGKVVCVAGKAGAQVPCQGRRLFSWVEPSRPGTFCTPFEVKGDLALLVFCSHCGAYQHSASRRLLLKCSASSNGKQKCSFAASTHGPRSSMEHPGLSVWSLMLGAHCLEAPMGSTALVRCPVNTFLVPSLLVAVLLALSLVQTLVQFPTCWSCHSMSPRARPMM